MSILLSVVVGLTIVFTYKGVIYLLRHQFGYKLPSIYFDYLGIPVIVIVNINIVPRLMSYWGLS